MSALLGSAWWPPVLQTALGAFVGAAGAIGGGALPPGLLWQKERQSIAIAKTVQANGYLFLINH